MELPLKIGIAGTGRMGAAVASRLLSVGHEVTVWNRTRGKNEALAKAGASVAATPAELATRAEIIITFLTDAAAIDATYHGGNGLLAGEVRGKLFIDMSTVRPETQKALAAKVGAKAAALIECPVGGTVGPAREGKLFGFVGGGGGGAGPSMRLAITLPLLVYGQALGEALSLCLPLGIDPVRLMDIFADTSGGPNMLRVRGPAIAATLQGKSTTPVTFDVDLIRKDLRTMIDEASAHGLAMPLTSRALECFDEASRDGWGAQDATMLPARWLQVGGR